MTTLNRRQARTLSGYVLKLLEYPRWFIDREVDFTDCRFQGRYDSREARCVHCHFGPACRWLNQHREEPTAATPLPELVDALQTAVTYLRSESPATSCHPRRCDCDTCEWLHEAGAFLRTHRHKT